MAEGDTAMNMDDLLCLIYGDTSHRPHCGHCGRPLVEVQAGGKTYFCCKHCADIAQEEKERDDFNAKKKDRY